MAERTEYRQTRFTRPPGATEILLVRHGESAAADPENPFPLVDGHGDPPLHDPDGIAQAHKVDDRFRKSGEQPDAVYVTTLQRTAQTAAPLLARLGMEAQVEPDLREVFLGEWEGGEFRRRLAQGDPAVVRMYQTQRWDALPGGENDEAFAERVGAGITRIAANHPDQAVAVFSHGGVIGRICARAVGASGFAFGGADNASISHLIVLADGTWRLRRFNDTAHLSPKFSAAAEPLT